MFRLDILSGVTRSRVKTGNYDSDPRRPSGIVAFAPNSEVIHGFEIFGRFHRHDRGSSNAPRSARSDAAECRTPVRRPNTKPPPEESIDTAL